MSQDLEDTYVSRAVSKDTFPSARNKDSGHAKPALSLCFSL